MTRFGLFLSVFSSCALVNRGQLSSVDEGFIFLTTESLAMRGHFRMEEELSGRRYSRFSPIPSILAVPFFWMADRLFEPSNTVGQPTQKDGRLWACGLSSCLLTALTALALASWLRKLNYSESTSLCMSLLWAFGTLALPYSSTLFHQGLATLLMVLVCRFTLDDKPLGTIVCSALLTSVQLTMAATIVPLFLRSPGTFKARTGFALALGTALGAGLHALTNILRGDPWLAGAYDTETFTTSTFTGLVGLLFSTGKGLLWFAPICFAGLMMLIPFANRRANIGRPLLFATVVHVLVLAHWWAWHGSLCWGPRLLLPILPLLMVPIADFLERRPEHPLWQRRALWLVAGTSLVINAWASTQPIVGFLDRLPPGLMSEWMFIPDQTPLGIRLPPSWFWYRLSLGMWIPGSLCVLFVIGLVLTWRNVRIETRAFDLVPWRAVVLLGLAVIVGLMGSEFQKFPAGMSGNAFLHFPIRGTYRFEFSSHHSDSTAKIGGVDLTLRNPMVHIEAPPMRVPITNAWLLRWTIPGEGQFRQPIPAEYLETPDNKPASWPRHFHWLLYLIAIPFLFDWILGGIQRSDPNITRPE
jgi:hypothetical protein